MKIALNKVGRRFNKEWIFKNITTEFVGGKSYAILGPNGSGKSTLLSVLNGSLTPSEGEIDIVGADGSIPIEKLYQSISFVAPYLELIENFTLTELINFHYKFKPIANNLNTARLIAVLGLEKSANKEIKYFSSGMKQRTKLALACCADTPILFLDEPTSNLDVQGVDWYQNLIKEYTQSKLVIVGSNQIHEYEFCTDVLQIADYK